MHWKKKNKFMPVLEYKNIFLNYSQKFQDRNFSNTIWQMVIFPPNSNSMIQFQFQLLKDLSGFTYYPFPFLNTNEKQDEPNPICCTFSIVKQVCSSFKWVICVMMHFKWTLGAPVSLLRSILKSKHPKDALKFHNLPQSTQALGMWFVSRSPLLWSQVFYFH